MAKRSRKKKASPKQVKQPELPPKNRLLLAFQALVIAAAACWIYAPILHGSWLMDDDVYITNNTLLNDPARLWKAWFEPGSFIEYYPIEQTLQWVQWQLWHENTTGYHVTNIGLHIISALLVWRLLSQLGLRFAWWGGLLFAVHPAMVESVVWIAEFKNTLSLPPFLLAMCFYIAYDDHHRRRDYLLALGFFIVAMLCKISMASFPVALLLYAWWKRGRIGWSDLWASVPFFIVSFVLGELTLQTGVWYGQVHHTGPGNVPLGGFMSHVALTGLSIAFYFWNCVWPVGLLPSYPQWGVNPPSLAQFLPWPILAGVLYGFWTQRTTWGRHALLGLGFFLILLGPFVTINVGGYTTFTWVMDHFLYIPILGVIGLAVAMLELIEIKLPPNSRPYEIGLVAVVMALLAWISHGYASLFINQETLWTYELQRNPDAWLAHNNLGNALVDKGQIDEGIVHYQAAVKINPTYAPVQNNWGNALMKVGRNQEAVDHFNQAIAILPECAEAFSNRGLALAHLGHVPEAIANYQEALRLKPDYPDALNNWGAALAALGQQDEAIARYQETLRLKPNFAEVYNNWGIALMQKGQYADAITKCQQALQLKPDYAEGHYDLGIALDHAGQLPEAIEQFQEAIQLKPDYAEAHNNWGVALNQMGRNAEAIEQFRETLRLDPNNREATGNLANLLGATPAHK